MKHTLTVEDFKRVAYARRAIYRGARAALASAQTDFEKEYNEMKNFNGREIMAQAWSIYREAAQGCAAGIRPIFGICLAMAWEQARAEQNKPRNVIAAWARRSSAEQINMLQAAVKKAAGAEIGAARLSAFWSAHELDEIVNDSWLKLAERLDEGYLEKQNEKRAQAGKDALSLVTLVYRAAKDTIRGYLPDMERSAARADNVTEQDGETLDLFDVIEDKRDGDGRELVNRPTEAAALVKVSLADFSNKRDEIDRLIIEGIRDGYKQNEIAQAVGVSPVAINKRLQKIRAALVAAGVVPAYWMATAAQG